MTNTTGQERALKEALEAVLNTSGARGEYHSLKYADAVAEAERLLSLPHQAATDEAKKTIRCRQCGMDDIMLCDCSLPSRFSTPTTQPPAAETREAIARIIEPAAWAQFDRAIRPYAENRGSQGDENPWYQMTYSDGCRTVEDARAWFLERPLEAKHPTHVFYARESLNKADAILTALQPEPTAQQGGDREELRDAMRAIRAMAQSYAGQPNFFGDIFKIADGAIAKSEGKK